jgi:hypothetical protein
VYVVARVLGEHVQGPPVPGRVVFGTARGHQVDRQDVQVHAGVQVAGNAPRDWVTYYSRRPDPPLVERLWLDAIKIDRHGCVTVVFDFGDLDSLLVQLGPEQRCEAVRVRP